MQARHYTCQCGHEAWIDCTPKGCQRAKKPVVTCEKCGQVMTPTEDFMFLD